MQLTTQQLRQVILSKIPEGKVIPRHTEDEHFYEVVEGGEQNPIYPSVTGKISILKDKSLAKFPAKKTSQYLFKNYKKITDENVMEILGEATRQSEVILEDAGKFGTRLHGYVENYMNDYIAHGSYQKPILEYIDPVDSDLRSVSALRAMDAFVKDYDYAPACAEILVYSHKMKVAGTIDGIGMIKTIIRPHADECSRQNTVIKGKFKKCIECGYKSKREIALVDTKTSNQLKDYFFFQVALYAEMLRELTGIKIDKALIVQLSKENGTYRVEEVFKLPKVVKYAKALLQVNDGIELIKSLRKDNQKEVGEMMTL